MIYYAKRQEVDGSMTYFRAEEHPETQEVGIVMVLESPAGSKLEFRFIKRKRSESEEELVQVTKASQHQIPEKQWQQAYEKALQQREAAIRPVPVRRGKSQR